MKSFGILVHGIFDKLIRYPLKLVPSELVLPILQGKLKGMKWTAGSFNHGCWLGTYERGIRVKLEKTVRETDIVYDIGAHVGYYTLLFSKIVGNSGRVFSFEPLKRNLIYLGKHLKINRITNVSVVEAAVSDSAGTQFFEVGKSHSMGHLSPEGGVGEKVCVLTLDEFIFGSKNPVPQCIKIDVEGAETLVLKGAKRVLSEFHPIIFLAAHGYRKRDECRDFLTALDYKLETLVNNNVTGDYELLATYQQGSVETEKQEARK